MVKYRWPVSLAMLTMDGRSGCRAASFSAAATLQPVEMPQKMPSSAASRRAAVSASSVVVVMTPVSIETSRLSGMKPSPIPSMPCGPHARRDSSAHSSGSTAYRRTAPSRSRR